jgi:hypothetical protein
MRFGLGFPDSVFGSREQPLYIFAVPNDDH